jgi:hypothetical protein
VGNEDKTLAPPSAFNLSAAEWEVLYLLYDALDQLRKMTMSFSELRYLAVEHTEAQVREAVERLLSMKGEGEYAGLPVILQVRNLANLPIYRISPLGRDIVKRQRALAGQLTPSTEHAL